MPSWSLCMSWTSLSLYRCLDASVTVMSSLWDRWDSFRRSAIRLLSMFILSALLSSKRRSQRFSTDTMHTRRY